ncbi:alpha/beta fold hydrolase [Leifsonia sp. P73]|uniref:alpha/beta fold hydrolase n=1 Tax=Leifsonia sp. P73 TaxID=3423959 RepID=UPI003DA1D7EB
MPSLTADDGVRLDYTEYGDPAGRPVVLLAGFKAPATTWRYQVPAFADAGRRVLAVDLRGHGTSDRPEDGVDMARRGRDVAAVLEGLDLRDAVLVGGSMGANTIWSFLAQCGADRVAAAVSIDQTPKMLNDEGWPFGFYGYAQPTATATSQPASRRPATARRWRSAGCGWCG